MTKRSMSRRATVELHNGDGALLTKLGQPSDLKQEEGFHTFTGFYTTRLVFALF